MDHPFAIKWTLAELLERDNISAEALAKTLADHVSAETLQTWLAGQPETLELAALGFLLWGLGQLSGREYGLAELLDFEVLIVGA